MRRHLSIIIAAAAAAFLLVAAAFAPRLIPASSLRNIIESSLKENLDVTVAMERMRLRLLPSPGYVIENFTLSSASGPFRGMPLLTARSVSGTLSLPSLVAGRMVTSLRLRGVQLDFVSRDGVSNIELALGAALPEREFPSEDIEIKSIGIEDLDAGLPTQPDAPAERTPPEIRALPAPDIEIDVDEVEGERSLEPEIRAIPEPDASIMESLLFRSARAADAPRKSGPGASRLKIKSIEVTEGRLAIDAGEGKQESYIENLSVAADALSFEPGFSADLRFSGFIAGDEPAGVSARTRLEFDAGSKSLKLSDTAAHFAGSQFTGALALGLGEEPPSIEAHVASLDLSPQAMGSAFRILGWSEPPALTFRGRVACDITYRSSADSGEILLRMDAGQVYFGWGDHFKKQPGVPFKIAADVAFSAGSASIRSGSATLGPDELGIGGFLSREGETDARITLSGEGLSETSMALLIPGLSGVASVEGAGLEMELSGGWLAAEGMRSSGRLRAAEVRIADISLQDLSASFDIEGEKISVVSMRGALHGGVLSGNGSVELGEEPSFSFDFVAHDVDPLRIALLDGALSGKARLVAQAFASGRDNLAMERSLEVSGALMSAEFEGPVLESLSAVFVDSTWSGMARAAQAAFDAAAVEEFKSGAREGKDLKAAFSVGESGLVADDLSWEGAGYSVRLSMRSAASGVIEGKGEVIVSPEWSKRLVSAEAAGMPIRDTNGSLVIPVVISGMMAQPVLEFSEPALQALIQERQAVRPAPAAPEPVAEPAARPRPVPSPQPASKRAAPKRPAEEGTPTRTPVKDVDDILKVIVGD